MVARMEPAELRAHEPPLPSARHRNNQRPRRGDPSPRRTNPRPPRRPANHRARRPRTKATLHRHGVRFLTAYVARRVSVPRHRGDSAIGLVSLRHLDAGAYARLAKSSPDPDGLVRQATVPWAQRQRCETHAGFAISTAVFRHAAYSARRVARPAGVGVAPRSWIASACNISPPASVGRTTGRRPGGHNHWASRHLRGPAADHDHRQSRRHSPSGNGSAKTEAKCRLARADSQYRGFSSRNSPPGRLTSGWRGITNVVGEPYSSGSRDAAGFPFRRERAAGSLRRERPRAIPPRCGGHLCTLMIGRWGRAGIRERLSRGHTELSLQYPRRTSCRGSATACGSSGWAALRGRGQTMETDG